MLMDSLLVRASCEEVGKFCRSVHLITRYSRVYHLRNGRFTISLEVDNFFEFEIPLMFMLFFSPRTIGLWLARFSLSSVAETEAVLVKWHLHQVGRVHEWRCGYRSWSLRSRGLSYFRGHRDFGRKSHSRSRYLHRDSFLLFDLYRYYVF